MGGGRLNSYKVTTRRESMVNSNLHNILNTVSLESQYDAQAKKVLAQKIVLAYIMKNTLEDFKDMDPQEIML